MSAHNKRYLCFDRQKIALPESWGLLIIGLHMLKLKDGISFDLEHSYPDTRLY